MAPRCRWRVSERIHPPLSVGCFALLHPILDLRDGSAGAIVVKLAARSAADTEPTNGDATHYERHAPDRKRHIWQGVEGTVVGAAFAICSATALVLSSLRAGVKEDTE